MTITAVSRFRGPQVLVLTASLLASQALWAQDAVDESPSAGAMVGDLLVARPLGLAITLGGTAAFLVSLPFTLAGGNTGEAAQTLVVGPARNTFVRCLGCTEAGYRRGDTEELQAALDD